MAAGLGFKDFTTGEVLTAADVDGYLMQGIWVFANATARDAAVTSPQEGNSCYLKDTDVIQVYSGSSWVVKSGGSSPLTTKGDLYTYSTTDTRIGVGANGTVLTADSAEATGLKWGAAPSPSYTWTSFTPTMSQNVSVSVTNQGSAYAIVGDVVFVYLALSVTGTGSANEQVGVALTSPITSQADYGNYDIQCGVGNFYDYSANLRYPLLAHFTGGTDIRFRYTGQNANVRFGQSGSGFTAAVDVDDQIRLNLTYRKA